jgi:diguanylate cyclase (GGDEF)-like protein/PAS domain S-box-containing protein
MARASEPLRLLIVEDDEEDYLIARETLAGQDRARFRVDWRQDYASGLAAILEQRHDLYLIDYQLGVHTGLELVREAFSARLPAPVLMLTGQSDYEIDLEATALGVTDYLLKQELQPFSLERSIRYAVSQHRAMQDLMRSEERYSLAVRAANDGIWDLDLINHTIYLSPRWYEILGLCPEMEGEHDPDVLSALVHPDDLEALKAAFDDHVSGRSTHLLSEHRMRSADGGWIWVLTRGLAIRDQAGVANRIAGSLSDIGARRAAELRLEHDAFHDGLTGLPNRALFMDRTGQLIARSAREPSVGFAVLFLDIDRFKLVNDSLSHTAGDKLLRALAARMAATVRPDDTVARIGGDEFLVLLDRITSVEQATATARRLLDGLSQPFDIDGHELFVTASVGIALNESKAVAADLISNADIAMYQAKRDGQSGYAVFDASMRKRQVDRLIHHNELRHAIEHSMLGVAYQPIVDLQTGAIRGLEALVRWPDTWPTLSPPEFVPIAEEIGLIGALGTHVLRTATSTLAGWRRTGLVAADVHMSVNLSARQLDDAALPTQICDVLDNAGLPMEVLRIELTESTLMTEPVRPGIIDQLADRGIGLHLDDFGTGYSSLGALHRVPVNALKIDRTFTAAMDTDASGGDVIVRSIIALAHSLGLGVIAEGIESPEHLRRLQGLGCEFGQGYLFAKPLAASDAAALLADWDPARVAVGQIAC